MLTSLSEAGKFNTFLLPTTESDAKAAAPPPNPAPPPSPGKEDEPAKTTPTPPPAPATPAAPTASSGPTAAAPRGGGGEASIATITLDLDGVGSEGVAVKGSVQLKVLIPSTDDRIAALEARIKELEVENADLKKKNRELGNKLTD